MYQILELSTLYQVQELSTMYQILELSTLSVGSCTANTKRALPGSTT